MKSRVALLVGLMVAYAASGFAQGNAWGVKGGVNIANASQEGQDPLKNAAGGIFGVFVRADVKSLDIQPEFLLSREGGNGNGEDFRVFLNYLQIPVLLHFGFADTGGRPFIVVGPALGIRLTARAKTQDLSDDIKTIDPGIMAGGGVFVSRRVSLEGRYTQSLMDIATDAGHAGDIGPGKVKNRVISIMLGIEFAR